MKWNNPVAFLVMIVIVVAVGMVVFTFSADQAELIDLSRVTPSQIISTANGTTTTLDGNADNTLVAQSYNRTWLDFKSEEETYINLTSLVPNSAIDATNITISVWINLKSLDNNNGSSIIRLGDSPSMNDFSFFIRHQTVGPINFSRCNFHNESSGGWLTSDWRSDGGAEFPIDTWQHYICMYNTTTVSTYVNGTLVNSTAVSGVRTGTTAEQLYMGATPVVDSDPFYANASIDELRIYNRSLTNTEILEIYNSGREPNSSLVSEGLVWWFPLNEYVGTDIHTFNQSAGNRILTLQDANSENIEDIGTYNTGTSGGNLYFKWNISAIPYNAIIHSVNLSLYVDSIDAYDGNTQFERITNQTWTEDGSGVSYFSSLATDNLTNFDGGTPVVNNWFSWVAGNFTNYTQFSIDEGDGTFTIKLYETTETNVLASGTTTACLGFQGPSSNRMCVRMKEHATTGTRPQLIINYTIPPYTTGSDTLSDVITRATWVNDNVRTTLVNGTDYETGSDEFTLINSGLEWEGINVTYTYDVDANSSASTIAHLTELFLALGIILIIVLYIKKYYFEEYL